MDFLNVNLTGSGLEIFGFADFNQLHVEYQSGIRTDFSAWHDLVAVGEFGRNVEGGFATFFQELDAFGPAGDDLADGEGNRTTVGFAAVEDGTVNQAAFVFDNDDVVFFRLFAVTFFGDFVLQAGSSGFHTFFSGVFFEERFAFSRLALASA